MTFQRRCEDLQALWKNELRKKNVNRDSTLDKEIPSRVLSTCDTSSKAKQQQWEFFFKFKDYIP